ncbi:Ger(x)C family spore germination protein [Paenibacillus sp. GXUN7292]|uniref:Ger(x)C family spore germination protein n=1 Tax=Paenibacillus sp. GXUN7292 TaxID=3422499 RepID=UPI003D7DA739
MKKLRISACLAVLLLLTGCWDIKDLQTINYITSVGLDYKDGKFIIYAQMLDFTSIAKQESGKVGQPPQQWVGKGTGETINLAINDLYSTMQQKTLWSHITSIVVSRAYLEQETTRMTDTFFRFRDIRYTPWVYGTHDSIEQLFSAPGFFNLTTLSTILNEPMENYEQSSFILPIKYVEFISEAREPDKTILLPSISLNKEQWKKNEKNERKIIINGVFAIQNQSLKGWFGRESLNGSRWMETETIRSPLSIKENGKINTVISMGKPDIDIKFQNSKDQPRFSITININGNIIESIDSLSESELVEKAQKQIEKEVRSTYEAGLKKNADLYSLKHVLYRKHHFTWKQLRAKDQILLSQDSLQNIYVNVKLTHSGMLRTTPTDMPPEN